MALHETRCPTCGGRCDLVPGVNVLPQFNDHLFVVCWRCDLVRHSSLKGEWLPIAKAKRRSANEGRDASAEILARAKTG